MVVCYTGTSSHQTPTGGVKSTRENTVRISAKKKAPTGDEIIAIRYQRLINAGFISKTKSNSNIPPLKSQHKTAYTKLMSNAGPRRVAEKPSQCVVFRVSNPRGMAEKLAASGLSAWLTRGVLTVPCTPQDRVYFAEKASTVTKQNVDGTRCVIHLGVDYDNLIATDALPEIFYSTRKHGKKAEEKQPSKKIPPVISSLNPSNWEPMSTQWDYEGYVTEGYKYKETVNELIGDKTTLVYIYHVTPNKRPGKTDKQRADDMTARFKFSSAFRKV